jgi:hypothetical protein
MAGGFGSIGAKGVAVGPGVAVVVGDGLGPGSTGVSVGEGVGVLV